ncbi:hypothetical protein Q8F55_007267 [Vanrija albida]|uniref:Uncharacterized protein n=1 Tax=Vanrija albida TaxID=181172 RepID=A0ABR3PZC4_9TREE
MSAVLTLSRRNLTDGLFCASLDTVAMSACCNSSQTYHDEVPKQGNRYTFTGSGDIVGVCYYPWSANKHTRDLVACLVQTFNLSDPAALIPGNNNWAAVALVAVLASTVMAL